MIIKNALATTRSCEDVLFQPYYTQALKSSLKGNTLHIIMSVYYIASGYYIASVYYIAALISRTTQITSSLKIKFLD